MTKTRQLLLAALLLIGLPCNVVFAQVNDSGAQLHELDAHEATWRAHAIDDYTVTVEESACYCLYGPYYGPLRLLVRNGKLRKATYFGEVRDGYRPGDLVREDSGLKRTIDEIFADVRRMVAARRPHTTLLVKYDPTYGFPVLIDVRNTAISDGDSKLTVTNFSPD